MEKNEAVAGAGKKSDNYYSVALECSNCAFYKVVDVLKGTPWRITTDALVCPNCEVSTKEWLRIKGIFRETVD